MMKKKRRTILAASFLAAAVVVLGGFAIQGHARAAQYRHLLDNGYQHAFSELTTAVGELDVALRKGVCATTPSLFSALCTQVYGKALSAQMALGELPYGNVELEQTASFLAKTGDYAMALSRDAWGESVCTPEQRETLQALSDAAGSLAQTLRSLQSDLYAGSITPEDLAQAQERLSAATEQGEITAGSAFQTVEADFPEVPSLIYDGPFSEHITNRSPRMLEGGKTFSQDEARAVAANFMGLRPEIFSLTSQGEGKIPTYGFSATVDGGELYVEVTRQGGMVLQVISSRPAGTPTLSRDQAITAAQDFLASRGYPNMVHSYSIHQGDALTIHFAPMQDGVYCYPDLIKVSIALDTGEVVGFEAEGYLMNHFTRTLPQSAVSREEAQALVGENLQVLAHQMVIIPTGGEYEVFCHEFKCQTASGSHVLVYVNAETGQEENILLLLEEESGTLAI
jgi:spore germination protein